MGENELMKILDMVIGDEEDVYNQRQIALILEELFRTRRQRLIPSGSRAEGVCTTDSDHDLMYEDSDFIAYSLSDNIVEEVKYPFVIIPSPQNHGYCMLICQYPVSSYHALNSVVERYEGSVYLSSSKTKLNPRRKIRSSSQSIHGPCLQTKIGNFEIEIAECLRCFSWPEIAQEWLTRHRKYGWPEVSVISKIRMGSCHVVPIGIPGSDTQSIEWRISFSVAERTLVHSFNRVQFIVYCLLKRISKEILGRTAPDVMCSYFIKTVLFHTIETTPLTTWLLGNLQECLYTCIRRLHEFISNEYCPHYFVKDVNLFRYKINSQNQPRLLTALANILSLNIQEILSQLKTFSLFKNHIHGIVSIPKSVITFTSLHRYSETYFLFVAILQGYPNPGFEKEAILSNVVSFVAKPQNSYKQPHVHVKTLLCNILAEETLKSKVNKINVLRYRSQNLTRHLLVLGSKHDATSGYLELATFYLMNGNIHKCVKIVQQILKRYVPWFKVIEENEQILAIFLHAICNRNWFVQRKLAVSLGLPSCYSVDRTTLPSAVRYQIFGNIQINGSGRTLISPHIHTHFLLGLCYYQQKDRNNFQICLSRMETDIEVKTLCHKKCRHNDLNLMGYLMMLQHNISKSVKYHVMSHYARRKHELFYGRRYKYNTAVLHVMSSLRHCLQQKQR